MATVTLAPIPVRARPHGRVTRRRMRRLVVLGAVLGAVGLVPVVLVESDPWQAAGLGLWAPGGGFLYTADPLLFVLGLLAGTAAFGAWVATGNALAPPLTWLGLAALAAWRADHTGQWEWTRIGLPVAVVAVAVAAVIGQRAAFRAAQRRGAERNARVAGRAVTLPSGGVPEVAPELSEDDLGLQRFLLDIALQPLDCFDGLDTRDQFREAAWRYQLNFCAYALALAHYCRTPAFSGYLAQAQANLIEKMTDKRVWRYWRIENLWGNLRFSADPVPRDNIMLTGYYGLMLANYETLTGDDRYTRDGSVVFEWSRRRRYAYDQHSILAAVNRNFARSPFAMFPCEPNWIFPACNTFGVNSLIAQDRLHATGYTADLLPRFAAATDEEFLTADGRMTTIRSSRLGFTIPALTSTLGDATVALLLSPALPETARRMWELTRDEFIHPDDEGSVRLDLRGWDRIDVGNYRTGSDFFTRAMCAAAAVEMGDADTYAALRRSLDELAEPVWRGGARRYAKLSTLGNATLAMGAFGREWGWHDLIRRGRPQQWVDGPRLVEVPYPDVLVARAVTDGEALGLVLRPGAEPLRTAIHLAGLRPRGSYRITGALDTEFTADDRGGAAVEIAPGGRLEIRVVPAPA